VEEGTERLFLPRPNAVHDVVQLAWLDGFDCEADRLTPGSHGPRSLTPLFSCFGQPQAFRRSTARWSDALFIFERPSMPSCLASL
jgi:hypothetical protein